MLCQLIHVYFEVQALLVVVSHEVEVDLEALGASISCRQRKLVRLLRVRSILRGVDLLSISNGLLSRRSSDFNLLEKMERQVAVIDSTKLYFGSVLDQGDFEPLLHLPGRNLVIELFHEQLHHSVALGMNHERGQVVERRGLQVADDKVTSVHGALLGESVCWGDSETGAHRQAYISRHAVVLSEGKDGRV